MASRRWFAVAALFVACAPRAPGDAGSPVGLRVEPPPRHTPQPAEEPPPGGRGAGRFSVPSPGWTSAGAMDARAVYLANEVGLFAFARADGRARVVAETPATIHRLAADADALYWLARDNVMRVDKAGGAARSIAPTGFAHGDSLAIDGRRVYWASWGSLNAMGMSVWSAPLDGSAPPTRIGPVGGESEPSDVRSMALDSGVVYVGLKGRGAGAVVISASGGDASALDPSTQGWGIVDGFAFDADRVYWLDNERKRVRARPKRGGAIVELAKIDDFANSIAVDAAHVYWGDWGQNGDGGSVQRVSKSGGAKSKLVSVEEQVAWVAVDDGTLYWFGPKVVQAVKVP